MNQNQKYNAMLAIKETVIACQKCGLYKTRTLPVIGQGSHGAKIMFIGEAPGATEDKTGVPFCGRAGQILNLLLESVGIKREDVYIANILKCRPPDNRPPAPDEILACRDNLRRQIDIVKPKVICTLGKFASQTLLNTDTPISALRGKFGYYNGIKVMPTFHPAYLLRNLGDKRLVWEDMKKVMKELS